MQATCKSASMKIPGYLCLRRFKDPEAERKKIRAERFNIVGIPALYTWLSNPVID